MIEIILRVEGTDTAENYQEFATGLTLFQAAPGTTVTRDSDDVLTARITFRSIDDLLIAVQEGVDAA